MTTYSAARRPATGTSSVDDEGTAAAAMQKSFWRLLPVILLCYMTMNIDRINVSFAALEMNRELGFSPNVFAFGAGLFFIGYAVCEIPSNMMLRRIGARIWISRIMVTWGLLSAASAAVSNPTQFYLARVCLGVAEAGFVPGMILYFTYWFPAKMRARVVACMVIGSPIGSMIAAPLSAWLLGLNGLGLSGWQWMFILEAAPAVLLGFIVLLLLPSSPLAAGWLSDNERRCLTQLLEQERALLGTAVKHTFLEGILDPKVIIFVLANLFWSCGLYGSLIWLPLILKSFGFSNIQVGWLASVPPAVSILAMLAWSWNSDRTGERVWHLVAGALIGGVAFSLSAYFTTRPMISLLAILVATIGLYGWAAVFWSLPQTFLSGSAAASGFALISSVGSLGGFFGPNLVAGLKVLLGSFQYSLFALSCCLVAAALTVTYFGIRYRDEIRKLRLTHSQRPTPAS
ncbi:MFS transporter [Paraburkholderia sp. MM5477-R1]|uniref:MFS transporter n=1 Tax=Paraburkholderia sp. MM5477-R1 TaxID=2991062 RepID=UPI003D1AB540